MGTKNVSNAESNTILTKTNTPEKERLLELRDYLGLSTRAFERSIGVCNGYLKQLRKRPSYNVLEKIMLAYPEVSRLWLVSGVGDMLGSGGCSSSSSISIESSNFMSDNSVVGSPDTAGLKTRIDMLNAIIIEKDSMIAMLKEQIDSLNKSIENKDAIITKLIK